MSGEESFVTDGAIFSMQSKPEADPQRQCLCCRPRPHVFCFGVHLPSVRSRGHDGPADVKDWLGDILYAHRFEDGRRVRLTLEFLDAEDAPAPAVVKAGDPE